MPAQAKKVTEHSDSSTDSASSENDAANELVYYPAYCYSASPTWFTWVKLSAHDIHHTLHARRDFQNAPTYINTGDSWLQRQNLLLFYLNHPIQFVQLVGVVVAFEEYLDNYWRFTVDDSSGATIEVSCRKPEKETRNGEKGVLEAKKEEEEEEKGKPKTKGPDAIARYDAMSKLDIGTVVQVKGQIGTYWGTRQLQLDRINILSQTDQEMRLIKARVDFYQKVLSKPWTLSPAKQSSLRQLALGENEVQNRRVQRQRKIEKLKIEREKRHAARIAKEYEREELKRQEGAEVARRAGHQLYLRS